MTDFDFDNASYADLLLEAKRLDTKVRIQQSALTNRQRQFDLAKSVLTDLLEENPDLISDEDLLTTVIDEFDIDIRQTVHFTINVEVTGSMELRKGTNPDQYSFDVYELLYDGEGVDIQDCSVTTLDYDLE